MKLGADFARPGWPLALVSMAVLLLPQSTQAGEERGEAEYVKYCAVCHGMEADGKGVMASALKTPPTDLTRLRERYGKPLPRPQLAEYVDGRRPVASHGTREMPVWGKKLWKDTMTRTPEVAKRGTIAVILDYLETKQAD